MSLLNEMLRNLDSRRQSPDLDGDIHVADQPAVRTNRPPLWLIALIFVAVLGVAYTLDRYPLPNQAGSENSKLAESDPGIAADSTTGRVPSYAGVGAFDSSLTSEEMSAEPAGQPIDPAKGPVAGVPEATGEFQTVIITAPPAEPPFPPISSSSQGTNIILRQPSGFYAVQLMALRDLDKMLEYATDNGLYDPLYAQIRSKGQLSNVLLLGVYPDRASAVIARNDFVRTRNLSVKPWIRQLGPLQDAIAVAGELVNTTATPDVDQTDPDQEIQRLLQEAGLALMRERLTSPPGDNALSRYRRVLDMVPNHPEALAGIEEIVGLYLELAKGYLGSGNVKRASLLLERAERVAGSRPDITVMEQQLAAVSTDRRGTPVGSPVKPALPGLDPIHVRQKTSASKTEQVFQKDVESLMQDGSVTDARYKLEQFLVTHPDSVATIESLFRAYLILDEAEMAQKLLDRSSHLPAWKTVELGAQLKVQQGNPADAVKMLESVAPGYEETSYYALLAGLYQKLGRFSEAASNYRQLLNGEPDQGSYWLGLAVSLDSLQRNQEALTSFQRARDSGQYDGDVQRYIEERISALSR